MTGRLCLAPTFYPRLRDPGPKQTKTWLSTVGATLFPVISWPENCSLSSNLPIFTHRMEFLENHGAGSRRGLAMAHHSLEDIFSTHDAS